MLVICRDRKFYVESTLKNTGDYKHKISEGPLVVDGSHNECADIYRFNSITGCVKRCGIVTKVNSSYISLSLFMPS